MRLLFIYDRGIHVLVREALGEHGYELPDKPNEDGYHFGVDDKAFGEVLSILVVGFYVQAHSERVMVPSTTHLVDEQGTDLGERKYPVDIVTLKVAQSAEELARL